MTIMIKKLSEFRSYSLIGFILLILFGFITVPALIRLSLYCHNNYDLGIYGQAVWLMSFTNINPQFSVYHFSKLLDHFEPILLFLTPFKHLLQTSYGLIVLESICVLLATTPLFYLYRRKHISADVLALSTIYLLLNKGTISALVFPVHPATWALFPLSLLGMFLHLGHKKGILLSLLFLFFFKEEYPLMGMMLAGYFFYRREKLFALQLFTLSIAWLVLALAITPLLISGESSSHASNVLRLALLNPTSVLRNISWSYTRRLLEICLPLLPFIILMAQRRIYFRAEFMLSLLPILAVRLIYDRFLHHYTATVSILLLYAFLPQDANLKLKKTHFLASVLLLFLFGSKQFIEGYLTLAGQYVTKICSSDPERKKSLDQAVAFLQDHPEGSVLTNGNIIPNLTNRPEIYHVVDTMRKSKAFDYLLLEKRLGDPWPTDRTTIQNLLKNWKNNPTTQIIIENDWIFFSRGIFSH